MYVDIFLLRMQYKNCNKLCIWVAWLPWPDSIGHHQR